MDSDLLFLEVVVQGAQDFGKGGVERDFGAADFARTRVVDELGELRGDLVGFVHDDTRFFTNVGGRIGLLGKHLRQASNDVERVAGLVRQAGGGEVHFLEMRVQLARPHQAQLELGRLGQVAPSQARAERGNRGKQQDDRPQP